MTRTRIALMAFVAALVVALPAQAATPKLTGTVGPGFTITLKKGTTKVTKLTAGKYTLVVKDLSSAHNFDLKNPKGKSVVKTSVSATGTKTYTVTLTKGTWRYVCDPHASFMKGSFTVS
jgi:plastocyanin